MTTHMRREIDEIPQAVARLSTPEAQDHLRRAAAQLRELSPPALLSIARGSSDHAATYLKYAIELKLGLPVASIGPSVATLHGKAPRALAGLAISQSGKSPDLLTLATESQARGATIIALTNVPTSPLAEAANVAIDIAAGPERAVAATKSYMSSIVAGLWLVAHWSEDTSLAATLRTLPDALAEPVPDAPWAAAADALSGASNAMVIARGPALGLAHEMALKLIETCRIHASAYSGAEVLHGPSALLTDGFPVLALHTGDALDTPVQKLRAQGAHIVSLAAHTEAGHPLVTPLLALPPFYRMAESMAHARGYNPDAPAFLSKETSTI